MAFEFDKDNIDKDFADQVNSIKTEIKFENIFYCPYNNSQRFSLRQDGPIWNHFFGEESDINKKNMTFGLMILNISLYIIQFMIVIFHIRNIIILMTLYLSITMF